MMKLVKDEVLQEMEAVKCFIEMAISCQKAGFTNAAAFFIGQAEEDCHHAFKYACEIDKYEGKSEAEFAPMVEAVKRYKTMEEGAVKRVVAMLAEADKENNRQLVPFLNEIMAGHSEEAYTAQKLLQKVHVYARTEDLGAVEDEFEHLSDEE